MYDEKDEASVSEEYSYYQPGYSYTPPTPPARKKKKGLTTAGVIALALVCSLLGGLLGAGGMFFATRGAREETPAAVNESVVLQGERQTTVLNTANVSTGRLMTAAEVYAANVNSTVGITSSITGTNYWGYQTNAAASGSGFILTSDGYILTNCHVIEDSNAVTVTTYDNQTYDAKIVGYDEKNDVAVLKIDAEGLTPVVLGSSSSLNVGDTVLTIGNPLGELTFSLTQGVVSALNRNVTFSGGTTMTLIQTDAAINSGSSGGALFNLYGEVVGITNAKYSSNGMSGTASIENISFAIPIDRVRGIVESIIENGYIVKPYIGVKVSNVSSDFQSIGFPQGAMVKEIQDDSPAKSSGLKLNDVITAVNGREISSRDDLVNAISASQSGQTLTLTVFRHNESEPLELTVTVGEQKQDAKAPTSSQSQQQSQGGSYSFPFGFGFGGF